MMRNNLFKQWVSLSDLLGSDYDESAKYLIQNIDAYNVSVLESESGTTPVSADSGFIVQPYDFFSFERTTVRGMLYLKANPQGRIEVKKC
jgi:hypothetical protein